MAPIATSEGEPALARPRAAAGGGRGAEAAPLLAAQDFDPLVGDVARRLSGRGVDAYLFGGAVRDALLGIPSDDLDLWVDAPAGAVGRGLAAALGGSYFDLDAGRGIGRVTAAGPRAVTIDLTGGARGGDIDAHLGSSDFTIDAMAVALRPIAEGSAAPVVDPVGGLADLRARAVRAVSPGALDDDPARLMRGPRIASALGMTLEPATARWIRERSALVRGVSPERVRDELLRLLAAPGVTKALRGLDDLGLLTAVIPELEDARGVVQPPEHHYDVLEHCVETPGALESVLAGAGAGPAFAAVPRFEGMAEHFAAPVSDGADRATLLALTCLLHDIAKPATRTVEPSGRVRFLGHGAQGAMVCRELMERLRFSRRSIRYVSAAVDSHLRPGQAAPPGELPSPKAIYRYRRDLGDIAIDVLYLNMADYVAAKGPPMLRPGYDLSDWERHCAVVSALLEGDDGQAARARRAPALVDGHDLMSELSLRPGPAVGELLALVDEALCTGQIDTRDGALALARGALESGAVVVGPAGAQAGAEG